MSESRKKIIRVDHTIVKTLVVLLVLKLVFAYLLVEVGWWQRHLMPNAIKFNPLGIPKEIGRMIEYLMLPLMLLYLAKNLKYARGLLLSLGIIGAMLLFNIATAIYNGIGLLDSMEYTLKLAAPVLFFCVLIVQHRKHGYNLKTLLLGLCWLCVALTLVGIALFDPSYNHWRNWLPVYFTGLHTHNYLLVGVLIGISYWLYLKRQYLTVIAVLSGGFLFLNFGYQIRSALVFLLVFMGTMLFSMHKIFQRLILRLVILIPIGLLAFVLLSPTFDWNKYSSGRITMYEKKYEMLSNYNAADFAFGKGKGADFITTRDWWYDEKNSHNDLLTFLVENGLPYTLLFLGLLLSLVIQQRRPRLLVIGVVLGYLATSLLSNGITLRPLAGYIVFTALAFIQAYPTLEAVPKTGGVRIKISKRKLSTSNE
ncbi:hypothetical protein [Gilvibacter sediminis]|uniref:hypothetical protein n=1 Tax=Gilvibacter sediminis TaxID=379071 RepID=UPI00234FDA8C|nr:hypothetical protein [Gilvibacter sediminis]MDC7996791.1 hypothetical protein [Gilvibacter sediminis]